MPSTLLLRDFNSGNIYHLRHQAAPDTDLFKDQSDYKSFVITLSYYLRFPEGTPLSWVPRLNPKTLASKQSSAKYKGNLPCTLHSFLLLPDHFHLVLKENQGGKHPGISELMRRLSVGYAMTYRKKYGGHGTIYRGKYKMIETGQSSPSLISYLHSHPGANPTYLRDSFHSTLSDYETTPRAWVTPLPDSSPTPLPPRLTLEK